MRLEGVGKGATPGEKEVERPTGGGGGEDGRGILRDTVGEKGFLGEANEQHGDADGKIGNIEPASAVMGKLRADLAIAQDRTGDEAGKECDEEGVAQQAAFPRLTAPRVTRKVICSKVKKDMPSGRTMCPRVNWVPRTSSTVPTKKFAYLKTASRARLKVMPTASKTPDCRSGTSCREDAAQPVIDQDRSDGEARDTARPTKRKRTAMPRRACRIPATALWRRNEIIADKRQRQKNEEEFVRVEQHRISRR